jgi:2-dehydro-3-deoxy-L-rhamnonate dehydrogenase (NAD+)
MSDARRFGGYGEAVGRSLSTFHKFQTGGHPVFAARAYSVRPKSDAEAPSRERNAIMNSYDLKDRVAIVTGGAQGIGLAVATRILASGGKVSIWDRDTALLDKTVADLNAPARVQGVTVDIADLGAVEAGTKQTLAHFGKIDILVNNAAIVGPNANTWEYPPEAFRDVVNIGLLGTFYCCRAVVPHMIAQNYGRIINIASVAGKEGNPKAPAYSSMKAAVIGFTKSLGKELAGYNIAANCVTPAVAKTTLAMSQAPDFLAMIVSKIPRGRMLELDEAASMICWLASEENSFTTAGVFDLSGGRATY